MKLSVIVPIYNSAAYLRDNIQSILNQTYTDFELILIDDGSGDESYRICSEYAETDKRVKLIHTENNGASGARNHGICVAQGEYIRFVDADDVLPERSLELLVNGMEAGEEIDLVIGCFKNDKEYFQSELRGIQEVRELVKDYAKVIPSFYYGVIWNKLYRADILKQNQIFFDKKIAWCEDLLFNIQYYGVCRKVYYVKEDVYYYIARQGSLITKIDRMGEELVLDINIKRYTESLNLIDKIDAGAASREYACNFILTELQLRLGAIIRNKNIKGLNVRYKEFAKLLYKDSFRKVILEQSESSYILIRLIHYCYIHKMTYVLYMVMWMKEKIGKRIFSKRVKEKIAITPRNIL